MSLGNVLIMVNFIGKDEGGVLKENLGLLQLYM